MFFLSSTLVDQALGCGLGSLAAGSEEIVVFTIAFPENAAPLVVSAHAETTSRERSGDNNYDSVEVPLLHPLAFSGQPVGGDCFEGFTTFDPPVSYVSLYRICL